VHSKWSSLIMATRRRWGKYYDGELHILQFLQRHGLGQEMHAVIKLAPDQNQQVSQLLEKRANCKVPLM
jgi:hypothetical protein